MYKVILVDDEHVIRQGLKKVIDWQTYGFSIIDEAENGTQGYEKIQSQKPDLILLDIRMPGLDGVALLSKLRQHGNQCQVIFITGYAEFEYAKKAIELHVAAFLTKPINKDELKQSLVQIKNKLDYEKSVAERLTAQVELEEKRMYRRLLFGHQLKNMTYSENNEFCVVEVQFKGPMGLVNEYFDRYQKMYSDVVCLFIAETWVLIFKNTPLSRIRVAIYDLESDMKKEFSNDYFISVGRVVKGYLTLYQSFHDVKLLGQRWFLTENQSVIYYQDQLEVKEEQFFIDNDLLFSYMEVNNKEGIEDFFASLEQNIRQMNMNFNKVKGLCSNCLLIVKERIQQQDLNYTIELPTNQSVSNEVYGQVRLSELVKCMKNYVMHMQQAIHDGSRENTIKRLLDYVDKHYAKDLKLERLGKIFGYNSSYLGTIFKKQTNLSFSKYLDSVRIEVAKTMLLEENRKVYEISSLVGYNSVDYFHGKFKHYVSMSPKQYQQKYRKEI